VNTLDVRRARIALAHLVEPGSRALGLLVAGVGPVEALARLRAGEVSDELRAAAAPRLTEVDPDQQVDRALARAQRLGVRIVTPEDEEWPGHLDQLALISVPGTDRIRRDTFPPHCVWLRGEPGLAEACERSVAVVGARASTSYGDHVAGELAFGLAERGWTIVSGGAYGIDAAAHRGALAAGGCTVAVLACGIDRPYPAAHAALFDRIADRGLLLSEWPPGSDPHRHRFLVRNRVIAALTRGTIMVEANARSGARQTLGRATLLGRSPMTVPGPVTSAMSVGCHEAIRGGARLVTSYQEVLEEVGLVGDDLAPPVRGPERDSDRLGQALARIVDAVPRRGGVDPGQIAASAGVPLREVLRALPTLEQLGHVVMKDDGRYALAPRPRTAQAAAAEPTAPEAPAPDAAELAATEPGAAS